MDKPILSGCCGELCIKEDGSPWCSKCQNICNGFQGKKLVWPATDRYDDEKSYKILPDTGTTPPRPRTEVKVTAIYVDPLLDKLRNRMIELDREQSNSNIDTIKIHCDGRKQGIIDAMNIVHEITGAA